jgi:hypothetical protein
MMAARSEDVREAGYQIGAAIRRHWVLFLTEGIVLVALHARPTSAAVAA